MKQLYIYTIAISCVFGISIGQVLFKIFSGHLSSENVMKASNIVVLFAALFIYGAATVGWLLTLKYAPLSKIYPLMALAYIFVPTISCYFLHEHISFIYVIGILFIIIGIIFTQVQ